MMMLFYRLNQQPRVPLEYKKKSETKVYLVVVIVLVASLSAWEQSSSNGHVSAQFSTHESTNNANRKLLSTNAGLSTFRASINSLLGVVCLQGAAGREQVPPDRRAIYRQSIGPHVGGIPRQGCEVYYGRVDPTTCSWFFSIFLRA